MLKGAAKANPEPNNKSMFTPKKMFFTKGVGVHKDRLASFELALRNAGIEKHNLVTVSSILPPNCQIISKEKGESMLHPGQIVFCVLARSETNEPNRLASAAIGVARPSDGNHYGYLSEHHAFGEVAKKTGEYAEDLAATMLATTLGIEFDANSAWEEREQIYKASGHIFKTTNICQSAEGNKDGLWTSVVSVAVFCDFNFHKDVIAPIVKDEIQRNVDNNVNNNNLNNNGKNK